MTLDAPLSYTTISLPVESQMPKKLAVHQQEDEASRPRRKRRSWTPIPDPYEPDEDGGEVYEPLPPLPGDAPKRARVRVVK